MALLKVSVFVNALLVTWLASFRAIYCQVALCEMLIIPNLGMFLRCVNMHIML